MKTFHLFLRHSYDVINSNVTVARVADFLLRYYGYGMAKNDEK